MSTAMQLHLSPGSSSVEPPAEYLPCVSGIFSSAAQPARFAFYNIADPPCHFCRFGFYNIGWQSTDKKRTAANLARLISTICQRKTVHAFGITEVFNIANDNERPRRQGIMKLILDELNVDSAAPPVWIGKTDVHYIFVWNTDALTCLLYEVISCGIQEQPVRKAQYFQFVQVIGGETLHVFHNHSVSSKTHNLKIGRKKRICSTFWRHAATKSSAARPAVLFGGDFNCSPLDWGTCFIDLMQTQTARKTVQICRARPMGGHKGDNAIAINVLATQETSHFGVSWQSKEDAFSDDHDVVLVPLHWGNRPESNNSAARPVSTIARIDALEMPSRMAEEEVHLRTGKELKLEHYCGPPTPNNLVEHAEVDHSIGSNATFDERNEAVAASPYNAIYCSKTSAAQPASSSTALLLHTTTSQHRTTPPPVSDEFGDSDFNGSQCATPPVMWTDTDDDKMSVAPSLSLPSVDTPLYNALLEKLSASGDEGIIDTLADLFIFDKLKCKKPHGGAEQPAQSPNDPYSLGLRVEHVLNVTRTQRSHQIVRLAARNDPRAESPDTLVFSTGDMKEIMNAWRLQPETWMNPESFTLVNAMTRNQDYHQACKKRFGTMLFELFGNKSLVLTFIKCPICSAAQPALVLSTFANAWHDVKNSPQACTARENSQKQEKPRLSKRIYELKKTMKRGESIAEWVAADCGNWDLLSTADQHIWLEYDPVNLKRQIAELKAQQQPKFPGIAITE